MAGILSYIAMAVMVGLWILGWLGIACFVGAFFDLELSTSALLGALLGPLGFVAVIVLGITERSRATKEIFYRDEPSVNFLDPFS
jgi:NhaP-type Na+/H+ or K+/H+ antiporter